MKPLSLDCLTLHSVRICPIRIFLIPVLRSSYNEQARRLSTSEISAFFNHRIMPWVWADSVPP